MVKMQDFAKIFWSNQLVQQKEQKENHYKNTKPFRFRDPCLIPGSDRKKREETDSKVFSLFS